MVQNRFFLNLRVTEDLFCWKDMTFKNNKQLLLLYQIESEIDLLSFPIVTSSTVVFSYFSIL